MTIPTPAQLAKRPAAVKTVVDTRCGATKENSSGGKVRTFTCGRHGEHEKHIDLKHNVAWSDDNEGN